MHKGAKLIAWRLAKTATTSKLCLKAVRLGEKEQVEKPWIFYQEGETVIEHGPNPYLALYYVKTENRKEMDLLTEEFYEKMHILDPNGQEVAYHNQIPDYALAEK